MNYHKLTSSFFISSQIKISEVDSLKENGFTDIICNRPAHECSADERPEVIREAVRNLGLNFFDNPLSNGQLSLDTISNQRNDGIKTLAYCTSGTRSAILWAFSMAGELPTPKILECLVEAGFPMPHLSDQINSLAENKPQ
ncbi:MAG: TIGR01244 family phosphatase [Rhodobacteraceae bacterium]|nr:TIGR01244 family phosphatase [Paracoccaceae bacterium]